jgi:hypothetical protein
MDAPRLHGAFLDRIRRSYLIALDRPPPTGIWSKINERRCAIHSALIDGSDADLLSLLADPAELFYGTETDEGDAELLRADLFKLGEIVNCREDVEGIISALDRHLGQTIDFPDPFGRSGLMTSRGVASYRAIQALYQACKIKLLLPRGGSIVEIGPGVGWTAYYLFRAGVSEYATIDLPLGIVAQALFLGLTLGPEKIWMEGDPPDQRQDRIKLMSRAPSQRFDLALNVDSLTEMPPCDALNYLKWVARHCRIFLSINRRQTNFTVGDLATVALCGATEHSATAFPMRGGYTEDIFALSGRFAAPSRRATARLRTKLSLIAALRRVGALIPAPLRNFVRRFF